MNPLSFKDRGKAMEEIFFRQVDQRLLDQLRSDSSEEQAKQALRTALGILDEEILAELVQLEVTPESILAVSLIPLVAVAWADGNVTDNERTQILDAEDEQHISKASAAHELLAHWLDENPGPEMFETWKHFIRDLRGVLPAATGPQFDAQLLASAEAVAKASGGYLSFGAISPSEEKVLDEIKATLKEAASA